MASEDIRHHRNILTLISHTYTFYRDGFKGMVLGKKLWKIILIKLFVMFVILKLFFFPNFLNTNFKTDSEKADYVLEQITKHISKSNVNNFTIEK
jgi:uncharacterized membrane protein